MDSDVRLLGCDPGWHPLPSIPDDLQVLYAANPSCLLTVDWVSCGPGCQRLADDPRFSDRGVDPNSSWLDGDRAFFTMVEWTSFPTTHPGRIVVVASTDGMVHGAWLDTASLFDRADVTLVQGMGGGGGSFASGIIAGQTNTDGNYQTFYALFYRAALTRMAGPLEPTLRIDTLPPGNGLQYLKASATTLTAEVQPLAEMLVVEGGAYHWLGGPRSATPNIPGESVLVGREVYWLDFGARNRIAHGNFDMESEVFRELPDGDILGLASDGQDLAWVQAYDASSLHYGYGRMELWSAPLATSPSDLRPHRVTASYSGINQGYLGDGSYFTDSGSGADEFAQVYSMTDGSVRSWKEPDAWRINSYALWAQAGEVAYSAILSRGAPGTIIRLRVDEVFHDGASP